MQKKLLSILLVLSMLFGMLPVVIPASAEETVTDGEVAPAGTTVAESEDGVIEIGTADELIALMGNPDDWSKEIILTDNIDLSEAAAGSVQATIGNSTTKFTGKFDGNGKKIENLNISGNGSVGLFGQVTGATIENLTVIGTVTSTGTASGGLMGYGNGAMVIRNVTVDVDVTGVTRTGGIAGSFDVTTGDVLIENVVNKGDISATGIHTGGFFGRLLGNNVATTLTMKNCVNEGNITNTYVPASATTQTCIGGFIGYLDIDIAGKEFTFTNCENYGDVTASQMVGGFVGRFEPVKGSTINISGFGNYGDITANGASGGYVGGLVGILTAYSATHIDNCYNAGTVKSEKNKYVGGIAGYYRIYADAASSTLSDCMNVGTIIGVTGATGGIIGAGNGANTAYTVTNLYNAGSVTNSGTDVGPVAAAYAGNANVSNTYYLDLGETYSKLANAVMLTTSTYSDVANLAGIATSSDWMVTSRGPELVSFHEHDLENTIYVEVEGGHVTSCYCGDEETHGEEVEAHVDADGFCSVCGASTSCAHTETKEVITLAPTCTATGLKNIVCANEACGKVMESNLTVEIDPENHSEAGVYMVNDIDNSGCLIYVRNCCGDTETGVGVFYDTVVATDVYVSANGVVLGEVTEDIEVFPGTRENPFASFADALSYAEAAYQYNDNADVTIHILDTVNVNKNVYTPEINGHITVTGGELVLADNVVVNLGGAVTFENIKFTAVRNAFFFAHNNPLVMGSNIITNNLKGTYQLYILGGGGSGGTNGVLASDITIRSGCVVN